MTLLPGSEKLLIPGSNSYYAWRFTESAWQTPWLLLATLSHSLWDIALHYRELSVAQAKLLWWVEEMQRTAVGQPEHPLTKALLTTFPDITQTESLLTEWVEGMMAVMSFEHLCSDADFALLAKRSLAIPSLLLCRLQNVDIKQTLKVISQQSEILLFDSYLSHRQRFYRQGQIAIPLSRLAKTNLTIETFTLPEQSQVLQLLLSTWLQDLMRDYLANWQHLPLDLQQPLRYPHILTQITIRRWQKLAKLASFDWNKSMPELAPLTKLWLAWRA